MYIEHFGLTGQPFQLTPDQQNGAHPPGGVVGCSKVPSIALAHTRYPIAFGFRFVNSYAPDAFVGVLSICAPLGL